VFLVQVARRTHVALLAQGRLSSVAAPAAAAAAPAAAATTASRLPWFGFVHGQWASLQGGSIESLDRAQCFRIDLHFNKTEPFGSARLAIHYDLGLSDLAVSLK
jgi:hypothetical protein